MKEIVITLIDRKVITKHIDETLEDAMKEWELLLERENAVTVSEDIACCKGKIEALNALRRKLL